MDKSDKDWLADALFDSVVHPVQWRPVHLRRIETMIKRWVEREVAERLREREQPEIEGIDR